MAAAEALLFPPVPDETTWTDKVKTVLGTLGVRRTHFLGWFALLEVENRKVGLVRERASSNPA